MAYAKRLKMQKRTEEKLNKVKLLIDRGITDQRTISNMLNISLPTVNKLCQYITKGIEKELKRQTTAGKDGSVEKRSCDYSAGKEGS